MKKSIIAIFMAFTMVFGVFANLSVVKVEAKNNGELKASERKMVKEKLIKFFEIQKMCMDDLMYTVEEDGNESAAYLCEDIIDLFYEIVSSYKKDLKKVKDKQAREAFTNIIKAYESMIGYYAFVKKDLTIETEDPNLATAIDKQYALSVQYITKTTNMSKRW